MRPSTTRPRKRPSWQDEAQRMPDGPQPKTWLALKTVLASPSLASKEWCTGSTITWSASDRPPPGQGDAAVVALTRGSAKVGWRCRGMQLPLVLSRAGLGAAHAVAETGAQRLLRGREPLAITVPELRQPGATEICGSSSRLAWASPTPRGADLLGLRQRVPLQRDEGKAVFPTPMIRHGGRDGRLLEDAGKLLRYSGDRVGIVGAPERPPRRQRITSRRCMAWSRAAAPLDLAREKAVQKAVRESVRAGCEAAHDCSDGGLAAAPPPRCASARPSAAG